MSRKSTSRPFTSAIHTSGFFSTKLESVRLDDPRETDAQAQNYEQHLAEELQKAANALSLRTIKGNNVAKVQVTQIKDLISL